jgi:hypothetical protein
MFAVGESMNNGLRRYSGKESLRVAAGEVSGSFRRGAQIVWRFSLRKTNHSARLLDFIEKGDESQRRSEDKILKYNYDRKDRKSWNKQK